ncbi:MAG: histidine kinase [Mameliella sp.]|nr:histidine kinase [Phaeodactylibacter sp.]
MKIQPWKITDRLKLAIQVSAWVSLVMLYGIIFSNYFSLGLSLLRGLLNTLPMMVLFYANLYFVNRYFEHGQYLKYLLLNAGLLLLVVLLRVEFNLLFPEIGREAFLRNEEQGWIFGAIGTSIAILVVSTFYQVLVNRYEQERESQLIIQQQQEAQLQFLRSQINPHFLFNTLNNIYSLAVIQSAQTAPMVLRLSNLLRYVVYDGREDRVQLSREVDQIREYIALFQMRSEREQTIDFKVSQASVAYWLEPMILIPLVENCFKHCNFDSNPDAFVRISLSVEADQLQFETLNSKDDSQQKDKTGGVGLVNIRKRLDLKYDKHYDLEIFSEEHQFTVKLSLPLSTPNSPENG